MSKTSRHDHPISAHWHTQTIQPNNRINSFHICIFLYLRGRGTEKDTERGVPPAGPLPKYLWQMGLGLGLAWSSEPGTQTMCLTWAAGAQSQVPSALPLGSAWVKRCSQELEAGIKPRHYGTGNGHLNLHLKLGQMPTTRIKIIKEHMENIATETLS